MDNITQEYKKPGAAEARTRNTLEGEQPAERPSRSRPPKKRTFPLAAILLILGAAVLLAALAIVLSKTGILDRTAPTDSQLAAPPQETAAPTEEAPTKETPSEPAPPADSAPTIPTAVIVSGDSIPVSTSITPDAAPDPSGTGLGQGPQDRAAHAAWVMDELQGLIAEDIGTFSNDWAVYVEDLESGYSISAGNLVTVEDPMVSASIIKIFVMAAVYEQIEQGDLSEDSLYSTIYSMITVSSNSCTNQLIYALGDGDAEAGFQAVNDYAKSIGCDATDYRRLMGSWNGEVQNYTSARDCAKLLRLIYDGECVSPDYSQKMLDILLDQDSSFPHGVPSGIPWAHKTGGIPNLVAADVGIVYGNSPYIMCIIYNNPVSESVCDEECRVISQLIYEYMAEI